MTTETLYAPHMSCAHCQATILRKMLEVDGVRQVVVELAAKRVTFTYDAPATPPIIRSQMESIGYPIERMP